MKLRILIALLLIAGLSARAYAQQGCPDPAAAAGAWKQALLQVDYYRSTYVLMYADRVAEQFPAFGPSKNADAKVGAHTGIAAEMARKNGITGVQEYSLTDKPERLIRDLLDDRIQAAVTWAPLAGWMIDQWDTSHQLSMHPAREPAAPPDMFTTTVEPSTDVQAISACSQAVQFALEAYNVVPTEPFKLDIFEVAAWRTPVESSQEAQKGNDLYHRYCAACHGQDAVMVTTLAPVNLLRSLPKFTYGGFAYITLKGRNTRGMPGYHAILEERQVQDLFQYLRLRSRERAGR